MNQPGATDSLTFVYGPPRYIEVFMLRLLAVALLFPSCWGAGREAIIFDTDSGLFGDDGAALVMLLRSPNQVAVQAVTLVPGNVWTPQGAEYVSHSRPAEAAAGAGAAGRQHAADEHSRHGEGR